MSDADQTPAAPPDGHDILFHFDPVCPFAWITSRWIRKVQAQRGDTVDWRFISLRQINAHVDYDSHFPEGYEQGHTAGLRMLRVCAAARDAHGLDVVGPLYDAMGGAVFDVDPPGDPLAHQAALGTREAVVPLLERVGLPAALADALDDESWDPVIQADTDEALAATGKDVGTPIIRYRPPEGPAFFGPVISRVPHDDDALVLWDAVLTLTSFPGFSELKRSLREMPALRILGLDPDEGGKVEDWHQGSRRLKK